MNSVIINYNNELQPYKESNQQLQENIIELSR